MRLIDEYEAIAPLGEAMMLAEDTQYSDLADGLAYIQKQLENAQMNLQTLDVYDKHDQPAKLHIIEDVRGEAAHRQRQLQLETAKKVISRFYIDRTRAVDQSTETDPDELTMFINNQTSQLEAMMAGELQQKKLLDRTEKRLEQREDQVAKLEQRVAEKNAIITKQVDKIEELEGTHKFLMEEIHEKERAAKNASMLYEGLKQKKSDDQDLAMQRIYEI